MKTRFKGKIEHNADTIRMLFKTRYYTYEKMRMLIRMAVGAVLAAIALLAGLPIAVQVILLMLGSWLLVSRDFPITNRSDMAIKARRGNFPAISYSFSDDGVELRDGKSMRLGYAQFKRLVEDERYLYLFQGKESVCMIDKSTISPEPVGEFMEYIGEKTGCQWERSKSLLQMNFYDLLQAVRDWKKR